MAVPYCPSCGNKCDSVSGRDVYPHLDEFNNNQYWLCEPCDAYCGRTGNDALGTPAMAPLRDLRRKIMQQLKILVDAKYEIVNRTPNHSKRVNKALARKDCMRWLKSQVTVPYGGIAYMDMDQATQTLAFVTPYANIVYAKKYPDSRIAEAMRQAKRDTSISS